jgi:hypothetical protein
MAIIAAGALIALGIYLGGEPRYAMVGAGENGAYRIDRSSGTTMFCMSTGCYSVAIDPPAQPQQQPAPAPQGNENTAEGL